MLINRYIITLDLQEVKGHTAQLQKIGVNVNQIAKRINETGRIYADDMDEMKRVMEEVWRLEWQLLLQFRGLKKRGFGHFPTSKMLRRQSGILRGCKKKSEMSDPTFKVGFRVCPIRAYYQPSLKAHGKARRLQILPASP